MRILRPLDRYVFTDFWRIFSITAIGFPFLLVIMDLTDHVQSYLDRRIPARDIALSYLFWIPDSFFLVLRAAVLSATVFSIGAFPRHSEVTAAKASGISFHRLVVPILFGAMFASILDLGLGEVVPITNQRRSLLLQEDKAQVGTSRFNFTFASDFTPVHKAHDLLTN